MTLFIPTTMNRFEETYETQQICIDLGIAGHYFQQFDFVGVDQSGNPVSGAVVDANIKRPTGANYISSQKKTTDATGWTTLFSKSINVGSTPGTWTLNLNGVTKAGATYNAAANVISSAPFTDQ